MNWTAHDIRQFLVKHYSEKLNQAGIKPEDVGDDYDLLAQGIIDSLGVLEMVGAIETQFGITVDLEQFDAESLTIIGPLSRYIEKTAQPRDSSEISHI